MTTAEIIRITMNSTTDLLCNKSPADTKSAGRKDNMITKNINTGSKTK